MELLATGFNAWGQLDFPGRARSSEELASPYPDDLFVFTPVLHATHILPPVSRLSYTLVSSDNEVILVGEPDERLSASPSQDQLRRALLEVETGANRRISHLDDSGNPITLAALLPPNHKHPIPTNIPIKQLVAYEAGIAALLADNTVWVSGDTRFPECLSTEYDDTQSTPALQQISWLNDLPTGPITKLSAAGHTLVALTEGKDLYAWGGGRPGRKSGVPNLSDEPTPLDPPVKDGVDEDVVDVAVGESHIMVLTGCGDVFVRGDHSSGQLGLGETAALDGGWVGEWTRVSVPLRDGQVVVGVAAGRRSSFVLVSSREGLEASSMGR